ncbi:MAG: UDP-N-acetylmuramoyl-tripeptide--D-alanyl-D-alanine ligase [Patescibacteria group bacterium]|jgi:UDP-N-acetylmuramoyl-tripeptide--D-alanyl-D-alanine ligase|nr:UDP-N-acetylmuramoyl-tripeptide--D-alanyl-D-alanine ligase [Patescibacteria group bacterium]
MIIKNLLYILQLELYDIKNFLKFSYTHLNWWNLQKRSQLTWTKKIVLIFIVTIILILTILSLSIFSPGYIGLFIIVLVIPALPFLIVISLEIIRPIDIFLKNKLVIRAKKVFKENSKNLTVIGITGSYGKTSTREILSTILSEKFKVIKLDENINTDLGIAEFIIKKPLLFQENDVFIVEMGAYKRGDIKKICELVGPDYSILTGINESHLVRFGNIENIIKAKFELPENTKEISVLNFDDKNVKENYEKFSINNSVKVSCDQVKDVKIIEAFQGLEFTLENTRFKTRLLALHNISLILLCIEIAKKLRLTQEELKRGIEKIDHIQHRLEPIHNKENGVLVIDDSYNGNFNGIVSGVEVLKRAKGRKIILTPGLVELGEKSKEIHNKIGKLFAENKTDLVLLIQNKETKHLIEGMKEVCQLTEESYKLYNSTQEAHEDLPNVMKNGDTIIFQNDLPDNYS